MKTLKSLFMLCAGLSFCACSSDNEPQFPEGAGAVTVKIAAPQTRVDDATITGDNIVNGPIKLTLVHTPQNGTQESPVVVDIAYSEGTYSTSNNNFKVKSQQDGSIAVTFYNIGVPQSLSASMNGGLESYTDVQIDADGMQASRNSVPAWGKIESNAFTKSGEVIQETTGAQYPSYVEYEATVALHIPFARLEVNLSAAGTTAFNDFTKVAIAGVYLDQTIPTPNGEKTNYKLPYDVSTTAKGVNALLFDNYLNEDGTLNGSEALWIKGGDSDLTTIPATNTYFAYNVYPGAAPYFKLCLYTEGSNKPTTHYAYIDKYVVKDSNPEQEISSFVAENIYRITGLELSQNNFQVDEDGVDLAYALTATVTKAQWTVVDTTGSWAQ